MGKSGYKKFKKQEKAKVKFKGNKTLLPKGQNVTDTSFKVRKIVVKEQLKQHGDQELLSKKHLNIKELISRLSHHNTGMRTEALTGLRELISGHGSALVHANLSSLLRATLTLTTDLEADVRTDTLKLLSTLFGQVSEEELRPLFPVVVCHLTCAMTHILPSVRADSLRLLDTMLAALPSLTAAHTPTLVPHFLDLISQHTSSGQARILSLNLDGRLSSEKWRGRVIGRLNKLFSVILNHIHEKKETQSVSSIRWNSRAPTYLSMFSPVPAGAEDVEAVSNLPVQEYAKMLMPLLLDTFTEAVPKQDKDDSETATCVIGEDAAAILQSIVEVILHIWNLLKVSSKTESMTEWFRQAWGEIVVQRLLSGRFPYSVKPAGSRKRRRDTEQMLAALQVSRDRDSCSLLNLQLCLSVFLLAQPGLLWTHSLRYIKRSLRGGGPVQPEESVVLCQCLEAASDQPASEGTPSLLSVVARGDLLSTVDKPVNRKAFDFLASVALRPSHQLHNDHNFTTWLDALPSLLCRPSVPLSVVRSIAHIATRKLPAFSNSLDGWIEEILDKLPTLKVTGDTGGEGPGLVVGLVYWVTDWDDELAQSVRDVLTRQTLGPELTGRLADILRLKVENTEDAEVKEMLLQVLSQ